ncbi:50S ribosomal protein L10 [Candidatus Bathyarchaeota archaeon]|nr:MAG: 50S ribosomal protein L10 [Candidatus Bathyarchaeota archaeon]TMI37255.1 MAG: 50S ribosomal protein L10 [Candidatus Bathyarchaeota archaeon]
MSARKVAEWKKESLEQLQGLMSKYPVIAAADLTKVRSSQIHELRKRLRDRVTMVVAKNNLLRKSVELGDFKEAKLGEFVKDLTGSNILLFSELNPYSLIILLDKSKVRVPAKAGDIATNEIMIPAGNTGLPPGPVISEFGEIRVRTRIEGGSIWIASDSVVARKGDTITAKMASVLSKLGLKPMEAGLTLVVAFDNGTILRGGDLALDLPSYKNDLITAINDALNLSTEAGYVTVENAPRILVKGFREALALAGEAAFLEEGTTEYVLKRALANATALDKKIPSQEPA